MRSKKADESPIWKSKSQIGSEHGLQRATNSPKIGHLEPALTSSPRRHDYDNHSPIAQLQRQHLLPAHDAVTAHKNQIGDIVQDEHCGEKNNNRPFNSWRFCASHECGQRKRQCDGEENHRKMRPAVRLEGVLWTHCNVSCRGGCPQPQSLCLVNTASNRLYTISISRGTRSTINS